MPDYYPNTESSNPGKSGDRTMPENKEEDSGMESALLPKSIFGGKEPKPGDVCKFKVLRDHGEEIEVEYVSDEKGKSDMDEADAKMDAMAQANMDGGEDASGGDEGA